MQFSFPRLKFLKAALITGAALGMLLTSSGSKVLAAVANPETSRVFSHGAASGDRTYDSILLKIMLRHENKEAIFCVV